MDHSGTGWDGMELLQDGAQWDRRGEDGAPTGWSTVGQEGRGWSSYRMEHSRTGWERMELLQDRAQWERMERLQDGAPTGWSTVGQAGMGWSS